ncbi:MULTISPECIES: helix-turn-helix domain-containing protein [Lactococcus]|uniref:helix-turn-helix domain-containing protein n=1 Tax=Lactococcus TaxID=1357 RepID=UPI0022E07CA0|nr:helix-turn-helix transcriptional regulator [Lactococcus petauri]
MDLYEKIKELSARQKISITALEEKLKIANGTIRRWGKSNPGIDKVQKVADYFNVSVDYLLDREEKPDVPNLTIDQILDSVENYSGGELNESDREMLRIIIEAKKAAMDKETKK